jgi:hypothetical protein
VWRLSGRGNRTRFVGDDPEVNTVQAQNGRGARRDYEKFPEAPDLGASVEMENEEHLVAPGAYTDADRDEAERIDEFPDSAGSAAPASGRRDAGENVGAEGIDDVR